MQLYKILNSDRCIFAFVATRFIVIIISYNLVFIMLLHTMHPKWYLVYTVKLHELLCPSLVWVTFTCMHLVHVFNQNSFSLKLQTLSICAFLGNRTHELGVASTMFSKKALVFY